MVSNYRRGGLGLHGTTSLQPERLAVVEIGWVWSQGGWWWGVKWGRGPNSKNRHSHHDSRPSELEERGSKLPRWRRVDGGGGGLVGCNRGDQTFETKNRPFHLATVSVKPSQNNFCESHTWRQVNWKALRALNALWALAVYTVWPSNIDLQILKHSRHIAGK